MADHKAGIRQEGPQLGLVHAHRNPTSNRRARQRFRAALLVERVPALVYSRHNRCLDVTPIRVNRHTYIIWATQARCEGVRGDGDSAAREIIAHPFEQGPAQRHLLLRIKIAFEAGIINGIATGLDAPQQRRADLAYRPEQRIELAHRHSRLVQIEQRIVACLCIAEAIRHLALQRHRAAQPGGETGEIVTLPGAPPCLEAAGAHTRNLFD